jgi:hypothetical protein
MASRAGAISAAGMIEMNAEVERNIEQRLFLAVVFVGQAAVLECDSLAFRKESDFDRVLPRLAFCPVTLLLLKSVSVLEANSET